MRYLLFDADQTIWDFNATEKIGLRKVFENCFQAVDEKMTEEYEVGNTLCWKEFENGELTLDELEIKRWRLFFERIGRNDIRAEDTAAVFRETLAANGLMLPGAEEFLESVKDYPKSLVTNGISYIQRKRLEGTGCAKYFDNIFISSEIGYHKPQKELFDAVLKVLGKTKDECVMIGDSENSDIRGASNAGIDSIYINFEGRKSEKATWSVSSYDELRDLIGRI